RESEQKLTEQEQRTIIFIDEFHRFNKAQQDAFLPHVEKGTVVLIGATTENPSFALNSPLLSRCRVMLLKPLDEDGIRRILKRVLAIVEEKSGSGIDLPARLLDAMARGAEGDARRSINILEIILKSVAGPIWEKAGSPKKRKVTINEKDVENVIGESTLLYDRSGEEHYNTISAFIKSLRGSDPDAAVYYMVRMLEGGEDPLYILRRMLIFSAEDIGMADPRALTMAVAAMQAFERVGLPEGVLIMTEAALYLATAPKSNSVLTASTTAREAVKEKGAAPVPMHLRNPVTALMKEVGYGKGYNYPHSHAAHWVPEQYLPEELAGRTFYRPSNIGYEKVVTKTLETIRQTMEKKKGGESR
ncbi:MAG: replication-associated recombination protein A, partial [Pseudomonadota bacterium]